MSSYESDGYVVFRNIIPQRLIETFKDHFIRFKKANSFFYSQSAHNWRRTQYDIDDHGLLSVSIENFTDLLLSPGLVEAGHRILLSQAVLECLNKVAHNNLGYYMWQNMIFDKSTETVDHVDAWYLDSDPAGHLIGVWFALEDIDGKGGAFHVYPGTHKLVSNDIMNEDHDTFIHSIHRFSDGLRKETLLLNQGDIILWHPLLIHGSSGQRIPGFSRFSLTAHYSPYLYRRTSKGQSLMSNDYRYRREVIENLSRLRTFKNYPILSYKRRVSAYRLLKGAFKTLINSNQQFMLMSRSNYY